MECHDVRQLLAFVNRPSEELDASERASLREHLDKCPDCSALHQADRGADDAIGPILREVAVPADLRSKILTRIAAERSVTRWRVAKRTLLSTAAALFVAITAGLAWHFWRTPEVSLQDALDFASQGTGLDEKQAEQFFADHGLRVEAPGEFDFRALRRVEVVEFKNRRVAKWTFQAELENGQTARAEVLILPHHQFRVDRLPSQDFPDVTSIRILHKETATYLIFYRNNIDILLRGLN